MRGIRAHALRAGYQGEKIEWVLNGIDLTLNSGEFVLLSGYSGCGKSTLLSCLNGSAFHSHNAVVHGEVLIDGSPIGGMSVAAVSVRVGSVLQDCDAQLFNISAADEIAFGMENLGIERSEMEKRTIRYAELSGIPLEAEIPRLSGGAKQRLLIASILAMEQDIMLLDEPLAHLDKHAAEKILGFLFRRTREGKTVLIVEHRIDLVLPFISRMLVLDGGCIAADLKAEEARKQYGALFKETSERGSLSHENTVVRADNLSIGYGENVLLAEADLSIARKERVVLLGENGTGKTTLLKTLAGLHKPRSGSVSYLSAGSAPGKTAGALAGFVFQNPALQLFMPTVFGEIDYASADEETTQFFLSLFGLTDLADRHPVSLSEGQKRRLTVAAVAAARPQVLFLDEPTVGQDHLGLACILHALETLRNEFGTAIVAATHDIRCARVFCDRVLIIERQRLSDSCGIDAVRRYFPCASDAQEV